MPYLTSDVRRDPRFRGWWPSAHPQMRSFLGVPIVAASGIVGAIYLTDKVGAEEFDEADQQLIEMLAVHAALAIEKANLYERSRELSIVEERNRLARELHDSVTQKLFGVTLTAEAAATMIDRDTAEAKVQLRRLQELTREAMEELRSLIFELRPPEAESEGLATALRKHVDVLQSVHGDAVALSLEGDAEPRADAAEVLRIAQEALQNALRHAHARRVDVRLDAVDGLCASTVADDGVGFDPDEPGLRSRRLGLTSMEERARALGGTLSIDSRRGVGTTVVLEVPLVIRVLIADDHAVVREGLRAFLGPPGRRRGGGGGRRRRGGGAGGRAPGARRRARGPGDAARGRHRGHRALRAERPQTRVIVLTSFVDEDKMLPAVRAGAVGYLLKDVAPQELVSAIRTVHGGGALLHPTVIGELVREARATWRGGAEPADRPRARGAGAHRPRPGQQGDRLRARRGGEDGQDPRRATSSASSGSPTERRRRSTRSARASSTPTPRPVLRPFPIAGRPRAGVRVGSWHPPRSSPAPRAASASRWPARSPRAAGAWSIDARGADALERGAARAGRARPRSSRRRRRRRRPRTAARSSPPPATGSTLLVNNASMLGPSPQPALDDYPLDDLERVYDGQRARAAARWSSSRCPRMRRRRADRQRHLRRGGRGLRGLGRLRLVEGGARAADRGPRRRAPELRVYAVDPGDMRTRDAPGGVPRRGHLRPPAARGQRARPARADRRATCRAAATAAPTCAGVRARERAGAPSSCPQRLEAHEPPEARGLARDEVRLLVAARGDGRARHARFRELPDFLAPGDLARRQHLGHAARRARRAGAPTAPRSSCSSRRRCPGRRDRPLGRRAARRGRRASPAAPAPASVLDAGRRRARRAARDARPTARRLWARAPGAARAAATPTSAATARRSATATSPTHWPLATYQTAYATEPGSAEMPSAGRPFTPELRHPRWSRAACSSRRSSCTPASPRSSATSAPYPECYRVPGRDRAPRRAPRTAGAGA